MLTDRVLRVETRFTTSGAFDPSRWHLCSASRICGSSAPRRRSFSRTDKVGCMYHLENTFLYRKMLTVIRTTITMGMGYRKVSTATQIIPTVRVFEKSIERMEPTISAGMICSVIVNLLALLSCFLLGICFNDFPVFLLINSFIVAFVITGYFQQP